MNLLHNFLIKLKYRIREIISYFFNYTKPMPSDRLRVVIFAQPRTGSTLLESLLCSTGHFHSHGELLNSKISKTKILFPLSFIRGLSKWKYQNNFIFGLKIGHLTKPRKYPINPTLFMETLYKDGWKIIYLRRRNKVKQYLSMLVVKSRVPSQQFAWHKFDDNPEELNISIDCDEFVKGIETKIQRNALEKKVLANIEYHEVIYEDDLEQPQSHQKTVDRILNYLSLEPRLASTSHRKVNTHSPEELISNYEEFVECLRKSGWDKFVE